MKDSYFFFFKKRSDVWKGSKISVQKYNMQSNQRQCADTEFELNFSLESYNAKCVCIQQLSATRTR